MSLIWERLPGETFFTAAKSLDFGKYKWGKFESVKFSPPNIALFAIFVLAWMQFLALQLVGIRKEEPKCRGISSYFGA